MDTRTQLFTDRAEWIARALCRGLDPNLLFPDRGDLASVANAKAVCAVCDVRAECLQYAIDTEQDLGIWGGATRVDLQVARRGRGRPKATIMHGTNAGYAAHRRNNESACDDCLRAHADYVLYKETA